MPDRRALFFTALIALCAPQAAMAGIEGQPHVRGLSAASRELIAEARAQSTLVGGLMDALERTDVVAYVALASRLDDRVQGRVSFLSTAGGLRYVLVEIDDWHTQARDRIAMLGHELQHALEVAAAPEAQDANTLAVLYRRIGWRAGSNKYETALARETGQRVLDELAGFDVAAWRTAHYHGSTGTNRDAVAQAAPATARHQ